MEQICCREKKFKASEKNQIQSEKNIKFLCEKLAIERNCKNFQFDFSWFNGEPNFFFQELNLSLERLF